MNKKTEVVFGSLGFSKSESLAMCLKVDIYLNVMKIIKSRKLKPKDLQKIFDVPHTRVSELMNARLTTMSMEKLINYLEQLGCTASFTIKNSKAS